MAQTKSLGELIKEARTSAGLTQEQLAQSVGDMTASDISKAERGQKVPTQNQLKQIAKTTGVTQKSLLDAAKAQDAAGSGNRSSLIRFIRQMDQLAGCFYNLRRFCAVPDCQSRGIIAPVFQSGQSFQ